MNFESELEQGNFLIGECSNCKNIVWPPSEFCNLCFGEINLRSSSEGKIIEFSRQNDTYFCLVEFEDTVRIMVKIIQGTPKVGDNVKMKKCGIKDQNYFFEMSLI